MTTLSAVPTEKDTARKLRAAAAKLDEWTAERDRLIVQALDEGGTLREVGALAGMTGPGVLAVKRRMDPDG